MFGGDYRTYEDVYFHSISINKSNLSSAVKFYFVHWPFFCFFCISNISRQPQEPSICIEECIRTYPKRSTRAGVQLNKCPADLISAMLDMVQKQQANPNHDDSQSSCSGSRPIQDQVSEAEPTVASIAGKVQPAAPLMDAVAPMPEKVQPAAAEQPLVMLGSLETASLKAVAENANKKSKKKAVGEMLADLKKAYGADNVIRKAARAEPETETETSSKKKKPEEIKETKPIKKRKADESSKKKEIQKKEEKVKTEKKEKPNKNKESKKKQKTENHTEKAVGIAQIEKTQQKAKKPVEKNNAKKPAVKMDKKNYTSRAYHKTYDQKVKEGMDPLDAKFEARKAHRAAIIEWQEKYEGTVG